MTADDIALGIIKGLGAVATAMVANDAPLLVACASGCLLAVPAAAPSKSGAQSFRQYVASVIVTYWISFGLSYLAVALVPSLMEHRRVIHGGIACVLGIVLQLAISQLPNWLPKIFDALLSRLGGTRS